MSGHSKWKTIQHKKGAADARRGRHLSEKVPIEGPRTPGRYPPEYPEQGQDAHQSRKPAQGTDHMIDKAAARGWSRFHKPTLQAR